MELDPSRINPRDAYAVLIGCVTPRPIAWVSSLAGDGSVNLAPFSFFNAFGGNPPCVAFSPTNRRDGGKKDTLLNVEETGEFVVNVATEDTAEKMNASSTELPRGVNEFEFAGLTPLPSVKVRPPRMAESPIHLECRLVQIVRVGNGPMSANLIIGEVVYLHLAERILRDGRPDPHLVRTIARLGGDWYSRSATDLFEMPKPPVPPTP